MKINILKFLFIKRCVTLHVFMIFAKPSLWLSKQICLVFFTFLFICLRVFADPDTVWVLKMEFLGSGKVKWRK